MLLKDCRYFSAALSYNQPLNDPNDSARRRRALFTPNIMRKKEIKILLSVFKALKMHFVSLLPERETITSVQLYLIFSH